MLEYTIVEKPQFTLVGMPGMFHTEAGCQKIRLPMERV